MLNYFVLLGLNPAFNLDLAALDASYFREQQQFHPDRFVGKPDAERQAAIQRSVDVNKAYQALKNPLTRAQHLLALQGIRVGGDDDSVKPSPQVLMEAMELRESPDPEMLARLTKESMNLLEKHAAAQDWNAMAQETLRLGYLVKARKA